MNVDVENDRKRCAFQNTVACIVENISARGFRVTARHKQADNELADNFESVEF